LQAPVEVFRVHVLSPAIARLLFQSAPDEIQLSLIEVIAKLVRPDNQTMMGEASVITRKRSSLSCNARSACFCAVMSRATFEAPITRPDESLTGEMVSETSRRLPSFRLRTVWK
jgi:hypothetical protein